MSATVSTHTLSGLDGTHSGGVRVTLTRITGTPEQLFSVDTDEGGRLSQQVDLTGADPCDLYELSFATGPYWATKGASPLVQQIALRLHMPDPEGRYHLPVILSPNSSAHWWSR